MWNYLRYSTLQFVININPVHWVYNPLYFDSFKDELLNTWGFHLKILMFRLSLVVTDGSFENEYMPPDKYVIDDDIEIIDPLEMVESSEEEHGKTK